MPKIYFLALILANLSAPSAATTIVDTGGNPEGVYWGFFSGQYFAGRFEVSSATTIASVSAYIQNYGAEGLVTTRVYSDGGNIPGQELFSGSFLLPGSSSLEWYGASGLAWNLSPGRYWLSFEPDSTIEAVSPGGAPSPLSKYSVHALGQWLDWGNAFDDRGYGIRISSTPSLAGAIPEPSTWACMLAGFGTIGLTVRRCRKSAQSLG